MEAADVTWVVGSSLGHMASSRSAGSMLAFSPSTCPYVRRAVVASHGCEVSDHDCLLRAARCHDVEKVLVSGELGGLGEARDHPAVGASNGFDARVHDCAGRGKCLQRVCACGALR
eukprot:4087513-Heterocapsa_arctica.AAC.1